MVVKYVTKFVMAPLTCFEHNLQNFSFHFLTPLIMCPSKVIISISFQVSQNHFMPTRRAIIKQYYNHLGCPQSEKKSQRQILPTHLGAREEKPTKFYFWPTCGQIKEKL